MATTANAIIAMSLPRMSSRILQYCHYNSNVGSVEDLYYLEHIMLDRVIFEWYLCLKNLK